MIETARPSGGEKAVDSGRRPTGKRECATVRRTRRPFQDGTVTRHVITRHLSPHSASTPRRRPCSGRSHGLRLHVMDRPGTHDGLRLHPVKDGEIEGHPSGAIRPTDGTVVTEATAPGRLRGCATEHLIPTPYPYEERYDAARPLHEETQRCLAQAARLNSLPGHRPPPTVPMRSPLPIVGYLQRHLSSVFVRTRTHQRVSIPPIHSANQARRFCS